MSDPALPGVQYLTDETGRRTAVVLDLAAWGEVWEDLQDALVAQARRGEETVAWDDLKREMDEGPADDDAL